MSQNADHRFYRPELDVLRFFAFLAVFVYHALPRNVAVYMGWGLSRDVSEWILAVKVAGGFGVDVFFTLSAYLITELLLREHDARGAIGVGAFYLRRALRIWPLYYGFLAMTIWLVPHVRPSDDFGAEYAVPFALFMGNWAFGLLGAPVSVATPLWSVSIEEQFYLAWPLLIVWCGVTRVKILAIALIATGWLTRLTVVALDGDPGYLYFATFARLDTFGLGALLAVYVRGGALRIARPARVALVCLAAAMVIVCSRYWHDLIVYPVAAGAGAMILLAALAGGPVAIPEAIGRGFVYLGRISYGLYVFHLLALAFTFQAGLTGGGPRGLAAKIVLSLLVTIGLAAASYHWLERPFLRVKMRFAYVASGPPERLSVPAMDVPLECPTTKIAQPAKGQAT